MRLLALVLPFLIACGSKPAPSAPEPAPTPTAADGSLDYLMPPDDVTYDRPAPTGTLDEACFDECMINDNDEGACTSFCTVTAADLCHNDCMAEHDYDFCLAECAP